MALVGCMTAPVTPPATAADATPLKVYAAGSLRDAMTAVAQLHEAQTGERVSLTFGASGLLRERIEKGEAAQVFASADTQHPTTLANANTGWQAPTRFTRNRLCAILNPAANTPPATPDKLLSLLLNPALKLGTSTPRSDPAGDYAWALFRRAEAVQPGAYARLDAKALKLTGSPTAAPPPAGRGAYSWLMDTGQADVFLTYCTNAAVVVRDVPRMVVLAVPPALEVGADYGVTARVGDAGAARFVQSMMSAPGQATFARFGFGAP
jgi:ABC-type molybdate transport system substrate-binding protein